MKQASQILKSNDKFQINLGLKRIKTILSLLGNPQNNYKIIHIAGTNGKGSVCSIINQILIENSITQSHPNINSSASANTSSNPNINSNTKIGLYTSPHLFSYCERIKINNVNIKEHIFNRLVNDIDTMAKKNNINLTEFELLTTVALHYFYINKTDYVILETGLGGRFDATNVVNSNLQIITTIDFDHKDRLGSTINRIAFEKAGIIKQNSKVIVDYDNLGYKVIEKVCNSKNAKIIIPQKLKTKNNLILYKNEQLEFNLLGKHQIKNLELALCAVSNLNIDIKIEAVKKALKNVHWRFRLEYNKDKNLLIDAAHNPSGIKTLTQFITENDQFKNQDKIIVFGCLNTKDYNSMAELLLTIDTDGNSKPKAQFYFFEFDYPQALKYVQLKKDYRKKFIKIDSLAKVKELINKKELKIFCGSIYMNGIIFS